MLLKAEKLHGHSAFKALLSVCALLLLGTTALDASAQVTEVTDTDSSVHYLRMIFGDAVNIITGGPRMISTSPDSVLGQISQVINLGMMLFVFLIVSYSGVVGILNSGQHGQIFGKDYDTMWTPVRTTLALGLCAPIAGGYSLLQILVLWIAGQGIGLANTAWTQSVDLIVDTGAVTSIPVSRGHYEAAEALLAGHVCMRAVNSSEQEDKIGMTEVSSPQYDTLAGAVLNANSNLGTLWEYTGGVMDYFGRAFSQGPMDAAKGPCGSVELHIPRADTELGLISVYANHFKRLSMAYTELDYAMLYLASDLVDYGNQLPGKTLPGPERFLDPLKLFNDDQRFSADRAASDIGSLRNELYQTTDDTMGMREAGWASAGAFYMDFTRMNQEALNFASLSITASQPTIGPDIYPDIGKHYDILGAYLAGSRASDRNGITSSAQPTDIAGVRNHTSQIITAGLQGLRGEGQAFTQVIDFGQVVLLASTVLYIGSAKVEASAKAAAAGASKLVSWIPGGGAVGAAAAAAVKSLATRLAEPFLIMAAGLGVAAMFLAYVVPAIPVIYWITGILGWMILVIEAVLSTPLWAASHAIPGNETSAFGKRTEPGYIIMLQLFMRPVLMLGGFFAGIALISAGCEFLDRMFVPAMSSAFEGAFGLNVLYTFLATFVMYVVLVVIIAQRSFGLIHEIPDKVLRFLGGGQESLGDESTAQQGKSIMVAAANTGGSSQWLKQKNAMAHGKNTSRDSGMPGGGSGVNKDLTS